MATGFPVKANYATGDILTATNMNDLAGTVNTLTTGTLSASAGKNAIINGGFDIWQRGTSIAQVNLAPTYFSDRWFNARVSGQTVSRQVTNDTTNLPNIQYCARIQRDSGSSNTTVIRLVQAFESINSIPFAGKTVTLSFYARAGANFSAAGGIMTGQVITGTGTDQNPLTVGYTGTAYPLVANVALTTTWQRFTVTGTIASTATELSIGFEFNPAAGAAGAADYIEVTGAQLELGSNATSFARNGATYQGELAACQRYYYRSTVGDSSSRWAFGSAYSTTQAQFVVPLKQSMRVKPSAIEYGGTISVYDGVTATNITGLFLDQASTDFARLTNTVASGLTQYRPYELTANASATAYIGFTAEL